MLALVCGAAAPAHAAPFVVNGTADTIAVDGVLTLREAITAANTNAPSGDAGAGDVGLDEITFNIPGPGVHTITVLAAGLPAITEALTIDGYSQPLAQANTLDVGSNAVLLIELDGTNSNIGVGGLTAVNANVSVRGLVINRFKGPAIQLSGIGASGSTVAGSFIGLNAAGNAASSNAIGISVVDAPNVTIGGTSPGDRNVVFDLFSTSLISVQNTIAPGDAGSAVIQGNYIGLNASGSAVFPGFATGIVVTDAPNVTIGGTIPGARNVISGGAGAVTIANAGATNAVILGNYLGLDATGASLFQGFGPGVSVVAAPGVRIGGTAAGAGNVTAGYLAGVQISGTANGTVIQGNRIGTNAAGTAAPANAVAGAIGAGVNVLDGQGTIIGGTVAEARNVISGVNGGIQIAAAGDGTVIQGNYIGTDLTGTIGLSSATVGVFVGDASNVIIGGTTPEARNVISGNGLGVTIDGPNATGLVLQGNFIGTNAAGTGPLGNQLGVGIGALATTTTTASVVVGGIEPGAGNVIAFNTRRGVTISNGTGHAIRGNAIYANGGLGIDLGDDGVTANDTGDGDAGANNLQNSPVLTSSSVVGGATRVAGTLNSTAGTAFQIDVYANTACDPAGYGEGQTVLGTTSVTTDGSGNASFVIGGLAALPSGSVVTATATDPAGNTSEFSACRALSAPGVVVTPPALSVSEGGPGGTFTVALSNVPTSVVTIPVDTDGGQLAVTPASLTFQPNETALVPQTVTVAAVDDAVREETRIVQIGLSAASGDGAYNGLSVDDVAVTVRDNDVAQSCTPRPNVQTRVISGGGQLIATVEPTPLNTQQNNRISSINFGQLQNARVTLNGRPIASGQSVTIPANTVEVSFLVERVTAGEATTVPFTVVDACGEWQTFVGGGPNAF